MDRDFSVVSLFRDDSFDRLKIGIKIKKEID